ncbi:TolC family protein [Pontiella agarivorans]|uniref:TolC family protein n=1 Tax=Pontiella agarivorans TaxID=3038953 RepID=A0ABU5MXT8_9BACT|nr:TolC family protein [Pontiella agarivorans]MDZ8119022.1 TolC family protein [Pontiella agarivorans]
MKKRLLIPAFFTAALLSSYADPFGTHLTLQAALEAGAENNPQLQAAFYRWKGYEENIAVQKALPDPAFTYGYYFESVETRVGPQNHQFRLAQTFPGFGKRAAKKAAATALAAAYGENYKQEKLNLDFAITQAYAELYYLKRSIDITQDRIRLIRDLEKVARTRYKSGSPMAPILQAQVELGRLEDRLSSLNDLRQPQVARLNAALNRPADAPLPWPAEIPYVRIAPDEEALLENLNHTSPSLAALARNVERGVHQVALARRERLPDFTLGVQYIQTDDAGTPVSDNGKDPIMGTIGINIPLWAGKNSARVAAANYQRTAAELTLQNRERTLEADIKRTLYNLRDADRKINLYAESLIPKAEQSLEVNRTAYEAGQMEFINLMDAERILLEFQLAYERALADHLKHRADLSRLTGLDLLHGANHETY